MEAHLIPRDKHCFALSVLSCLLHNLSFALVSILPMFPANSSGQEDRKLPAV